MKRHTFSIPKKIVDFFEDLEDAERGMAYSILLKYLETGVVEPLDGKPSAVKLAIKYAVEKLRRRIERRFPQPAVQTTPESEPVNSADPADAADSHDSIDPPVPVRQNSFTTNMPPADKATRKHLTSHHPRKRLSRA